MALCASGAAEAASSGAALHEFATTPSWVKPITAEYAAPLPAAGVSRGSWYLLLDSEINIRSDGSDFYERTATRVVNATGVDEQSQIDVTVDPTYQTLSINSLRVIRDGRVIDEKSLARITALPQETQLRERIYDGSYNINILLSDVRVGDVVDYAYTLHSTERNFPGLTSDRLAVGWTDPVRRQRLRVLAPRSLAISYRAEDGTAPTASLFGDLQELTWEWHDLTAIPADDDVPSWYSVWPHLEISTAKDWSEVAKRIAPLFAVHTANIPALMAVVRKIRDSGGSQADQALRALQFVQEQIRYVSISIGRGAFQPAKPEVVLNRRFGDCKDKALLLTTLLRQLGIEAAPALVNSRRKRALDVALPTPYVFDHAIVRARIGADVFWLDATAEKQFSPLSTGSPAHFERALVIDPGSTGLEVIPQPLADVSRKRSEVLIDASRGTEKPATLRISTFYEGRLADTTRSDLADESSAKLQSDYSNYIVRYYPGAKTSAPLKIIDDPIKNVIEVRELYALAEPFTKKSSGRLELFLHGDELYRQLDGVDSSVRKSPFAIAYPLQIQQTVRALLPATWNIRNEEVKISNPAFRYDSKVSYAEHAGSSEVTAGYFYQSLSDSVDIAALPRYLADRKRAYDDVGLSIWTAAQTGETTIRAVAKTLAPIPLLVASVSFLFALWFMYRFVFRWDPPPAASYAGWPVGIRGWLLIPAVPAALWPFVLCATLIRDLKWFDVDRWSGDLAPSLNLMHLALIVAAVLLLVAQSLLAYLFFTHRSSAPRLLLASLWVVFAYSILSIFVSAGGHLVWGSKNINLAAAQTLGALLRNVALSAYLLLSKRVKATFVRRLRRPTSANIDTVYPGTDTPLSS